MNYSVLLTLSKINNKLITKKFVKLWCRKACSPENWVKINHKRRESIQLDTTFKTTLFCMEDRIIALFSDSFIFPTGCWLGYMDLRVMKHIQHTDEHKLWSGEKYFRHKQDTANSELNEHRLKMNGASMIYFT